MQWVRSETTKDRALVKGPHFETVLQEYDVASHKSKLFLDKDLES